MRSTEIRRGACAETPICLLHIGKTGGSFLRSILKTVESLPANLHILKHSDTLESTRRRFGDDRQLAFVVREPKSRFVSAFNSRMRQGRPTYSSQWSAAEAAAFQWFEDANSLAEALGADDDRMRSAAYFAMDNIQHLKLNYQHFLTSVAELKREKRNIRCCVDLTELDAKLSDVLTAMGVKGLPLDKHAKRHETPAAPIVLSEIAERNLREYWAHEFEIYEYCRETL